MITFLKGVLADKTPYSAVIEAAGVGYEVQIPLSTYERLGLPGEPAFLHTYFHVREDAHVLYGFATPEERQVFLALLSVSGVGPKTALAALSTYPPSTLVELVAREDSTGLSRISGVGKKTAERVVLELKDKVKTLGIFSGGTAAGTIRPDGPAAQALAALLALGYKDAVARRALEGLLKENPGAKVEDLIRNALGKL